MAPKAGVNISIFLLFTVLLSGAMLFAYLSHEGSRTAALIHSSGHQRYLTETITRQALYGATQTGAPTISPNISQAIDQQIAALKNNHAAIKQASPQEFENAATETGIAADRLVGLFAQNTRTILGRAANAADATLLQNNQRMADEIVTFYDALTVNIQDAHERRGMLINSLVIVWAMMTLSFILALIYFYFRPFLALADEQKNKAEKELSFLKEIVNTSFDAVISIDAEQRIVLFSSEAEKMFGYKAEDVIDQPITILIPRESQEKHTTQAKAYIDNTQGGTRQMAEWRKITGVAKDGRNFPILSRIMRHDGHTHKAASTATIRDLTPYEKREEMLQQALLESEQATDRLRAFFAQFTHEFRTPLNAILGFSELVEHYVQNQRYDQLAEYVGYISDGADRLNDLIANILSFRDIDHISETFPAEEVDIAKVIQEEAAHAKRKYHADMMTVKLTGAPLTVFVVPELAGRFFRQIVDIFHHRSKAEGRLKIHISGDSIEIACKNSHAATALTSIFRELDEIKSLHFDDVIKFNDRWDMRVFTLWKLEECCNIQVDTVVRSSGKFTLRFGFNAVDGVDRRQPLPAAYIASPHALTSAGSDYAAVRHAPNVT